MTGHMILDMLCLNVTKMTYLVILGYRLIYSKKLTFLTKSEISQPTLISFFFFFLLYHRLFNLFDLKVSRCTRHMLPYAKYFEYQAYFNYVKAACF